MCLIRHPFVMMSVLYAKVVSGDLNVITTPFMISVQYVIEDCVHKYECYSICYSVK